MVSACVCLFVRLGKKNQQAKPSQQARTRMPHKRNPSAKEIVTSNKKAHIIAEQCTARRMETHAPPISATTVGAVVQKRANKKKKKGGACKQQTRKSKHKAVSAESHARNKTGYRPPQSPQQANKTPVHGNREANKRETCRPTAKEKMGNTKKNKTHMDTKKNSGEVH